MNTKFNTNTNWYDTFDFFESVDMKSKMRREKKEMKRKKIY
jgi:hypothetical protein